MKKAWRTTLMGIASIVAAETRGKAASITVRCCREAYPTAAFKDVRVRRAPEHDLWAEVDASGHCWDEARLPVRRTP